MIKCVVLIPYFEAGQLLIDSIRSIGRDCPDGTKVLVVDDGSQDSPAEVALLSARNLGVDVSLITLASNMGIAHALNVGLRSAKNESEFIARLDCGDLCVNGRLGKQLDFMEAHPSIAMVGSWVDFVEPSGNYLYTVRHPEGWEAIERRMHVNCAFTHPSVMFRTSLLARVGEYPTNRPAAEDYALFFEIARRFEVANIPEVLIQASIDPDGISTRARRRQLFSRIQILMEYFSLRPVALYGLVRAAFQLLTPRSVTVRLRRLLAVSI